MSAPVAVDALLAAVAPADDGARRAARSRQRTLVKPPGSLGRVEDLGARLAAIAGRCPPPVPAAPAVIVAAADHGVHAQLAEPWPQQVTGRMVALIADGRAAVNALARVAGASVTALDVGCVDAPAPHPSIRAAAVRRGTADTIHAPAMARKEARDAIAAGATLAGDLIDAGADLLVTGDMGIANTTASACVIAALTGAGPAAVTGRGAGASDAALDDKVLLVRRVLDRHRPNPADPLGVVAAVGGLEHAALVGVMLAGAVAGVPVLLDGVITNAAALVAAGMCPPVTDYLVAAHRSAEPGAGVALGHLALRPLLDLDLRLGEGTGGVLAVPLVQAAARVLRDVATLDALDL